MLSLWLLQVFGALLLRRGSSSSSQSTNAPRSSLLAASLVLLLAQVREQLPAWDMVKPTFTALVGLFYKPFTLWLHKFNFSTSHDRAAFHNRHVSYRWRASTQSPLCCLSARTFHWSTGRPNHGRAYCNTEYWCGARPYVLQYANSC
jgi:hypothetical protein